MKLHSVQSVATKVYSHLLDSHLPPDVHANKADANTRTAQLLTPYWARAAHILTPPSPLLIGVQRAAGSFNRLETDSCGTWAMDDGSDDDMAVKAAEALGALEASSLGYEMNQRP